MKIDHANSFIPRHIGPDAKAREAMLQTLGVKSLDDLLEKTLPQQIRWKQPLDLPEGMGEQKLLEYAWTLASKNQVFKSHIGQGYYDCVTPPVILRNILESPGWYTAYTPYQAEISQGRMEALLNFQTMVMDLTGTEDHYQVVVISPVFEGKMMIQQHRMVMATVQAEIDSGEVHALTMKTFTPEQFAARGAKA